MRECVAEIETMRLGILKEGNTKIIYTMRIDLSYGFLICGLSFQSLSYVSTCRYLQLGRLDP